MTANVSNALALPVKQLCRLCYYETNDTTSIFSPKGLEIDFKGKINKYLYLQVHKLLIIFFKFLTKVLLI